MEEKYLKSTCFDRAIEHESIMAQQNIEENSI